MTIVLLVIRNGSFFFGPESWLQDGGSHYDFSLWIVRRRIYKNSINVQYFLSLPAFFLLLPAILSLLLLRWAILSAWRLTVLLLRL